MNNQELIRILDRDHLLVAVELLTRRMIYPNDDLCDIENEIYDLPDNVLDYCESLTDYQRLKLMQSIINTLIHEAEQSTVRHFQTLLPLKSEDFYRP
ncbi:hypothetical protein H6G81_35050 [Scytonema hofmannii FACHB-248]|uniref:Uncharacterized protein n=1 Tax=Scytonema hofmannii FACHB-248 TaxID=1842502 RepID=A0ABR8H171_9CYAN|nr:MULTISPECIES: hypothetical protein [Nostocales]MBD2609570.1 hypothetical protein [Scytonema hofmannii FACHB-248]